MIEPRETIAAWAAGRFYPLAGEDASRTALDDLQDAMAAEPKDWWSAFVEVLRAGDQAAVGNLGSPLARLLYVAQPELHREIAAAARIEPKVAEAFWSAMEDLRAQRLAYRELGRVLVVSTYRDYCETDSWEYSWSFSALLYLLEDEPDELWSIGLDLLRTGDDEMPRIVGAVILEELLERYLDRYVEQMEAEAQRDPRFKLALGTVYLSKVPAQLVARVQAAADKKLV